MSKAVHDLVPALVMCGLFWMFTTGTIGMLLLLKVSVEELIATRRMRRQFPVEEVLYTSYHNVTPADVWRESVLSIREFINLLDRIIYGPFLRLWISIWDMRQKPQPQRYWYHAPQPRKHSPVIRVIRAEPEDGREFPSLAVVFLPPRPAPPRVNPR